MVSREQGGQVSAPNDAGHQRRGRSHGGLPPVPMTPRVQSSQAEEEQRQGECDPNEVAMQRPRSPGWARRALPALEQHPCWCLMCRLLATQTAPCRTSRFPLVPSQQKTSRRHADTLVAETGLIWWWVTSQERHGQAGGGRMGPHRECGGLSRSCESPAANSRVNLSV